MTELTIELKQLLLKPPFEVIVSLCDVVDDLTEDNQELGFSTQNLSEEVLSLFTNANLLPEIFHELIQTEVENTCRITNPTN